MGFDDKNVCQIFLRGGRSLNKQKKKTSINEITVKNVDKFEGESKVFHSSYSITMNGLAKLH